jgi:hypothetical protein
MQLDTTRSMYAKNSAVHERRVSQQSMTLRDIRRVFTKSNQHMARAVSTSVLEIAAQNMRENGPDLITSSNT